MHGSQNSIGECLAKDRFDSLIAESAHEGVCKRNLPKAIDGGFLFENTASDERSEPPALLTEFDQLGICDRSPSLAELLRRNVGEVSHCCHPATVSSAAASGPLAFPCESRQR